MHPGEPIRDQTSVPGPRPLLPPLRQTRRYQLPCAPPQPPAIELLSSLVLKNLVRVEPETTLGAEPETRFRLLETLREYAWDCLVAENDAEEAQLRHASSRR